MAVLILNFVQPCPRIANKLPWKGNQKIWTHMHILNIFQNEYLKPFKTKMLIACISIFQLNDLIVNNEWKGYKDKWLTLLIIAVAECNACDCYK